MQSYGRFIYAISITLFSLLVTYLMSRVSNQVEFQRAQERQLEWQKALDELQKAQTS
jgi:cbb3-type cytochrome oxidase subunit 3